MQGQNQKKMGTITENAPGRIGFLEELSDIFVRLFPDLWKLGQAYFGGELFVKVDSSKQEEFKVFFFFNYLKKKKFIIIIFFFF